MPIGIGAGTAIAGIAGAGAAATGAVISSKASGHAADLQTSAANHAADVQAKSAADQLAFNEQQAGITNAQTEANRKGNYDLAAARTSRLGSISEALGGPGASLPAYVPLPTGAPSGNMGVVGPSVGQALNTPPTAAPAGNLQAPALGTQPASSSIGALSNPQAWMGLVGNDAQLTAFVQSGLGPNASPSLVNYYKTKIQGQPGANPTEQAGSAAYWLQKLKSDPSVTGQPSSASPSTQSQTPAWGSIGDLLQRPALTGNLTAPGPYGA